MEVFFMAHAVAKKIGYTILVIYLTLVTLACGVLGYLYFRKTAKDLGISLNEMSAKILVNTACLDLGLIDKAEFDAAVREPNISSTTLEFDIDNSKDFDEQLINYMGGRYMIGFSVLSLKYILDGNLKQNVPYLTKDENGVGNIIKYVIKDDKIILNAYPPENSKEILASTGPEFAQGIEDGEDVVIGQSLILQQTKDGWNSKYLIWNSGQDNSLLMEQNFFADKAGTYAFAGRQIVFDGYKIAFGAYPKFKKYTKLDDTILGVRSVSQDLKTHQKGAFWGKGATEMLEGFKAMSEEDSVKCINEGLDLLDLLDLRSYNQVKNWKMEESDYQLKVIEKLKEIYPPIGE